MGLYLNPGIAQFKRSRNDKIYVDKSELISITNQFVGAENCNLCVSRPRRFGKTMALGMLSAYYQKGTDSHELFKGLKIEQDPSFEKYINQYDVFSLTMTEFFNKQSSNIQEQIAYLEEEIIFELKEAYPSVNFERCRYLHQYFSQIFYETNRQFVILIDEWDCIFRVFKENQSDQTLYLDFLRNWLKNKPYVALAYMTGILPIKKYGEHSALNMFKEYSMVNAGPLTPFTGFLTDEVRALCSKYGEDFELCKSWYDGYQMRYPLNDKPNRPSKLYEIYNPVSVVSAMLDEGFTSYWTSTETYEALKQYIDLDMDGLRDKILNLIAGNRTYVDVGSFKNDMTTFESADDVLTLLVHLGYLGYDIRTQEVFIPNKEIYAEFTRSVKGQKGWNRIVKAIETSEKTLKAVLEGNGEAVAESLESLHDEGSILQYNDEESLACAIRLCFLTAGRLYNVVREMPTGKGFADIAFIPRPFCKGPAIIVELKYNKTVNTAMDQIKARGYCNKLGDFSITGKVILVAVNYEKDSTKPDYKKHTCLIETMNAS